MGIRELELAGLHQAADPPLDRLSALWERVIHPFRIRPTPQPHPPTGFYTDTTVCIGCKACEVACKQWNQLAADEYQWTGMSYDNTVELSATSWRHVKFIEQFPSNGLPAHADAAGPGPPGKPVTLEGLLDGAGAAAVAGSGRWLMMSDVCKHCAAAPCQHACPTGAIIYNEFANVYIQPDICNGCSYCIAACPFGVISRSTFDGHSHKCTLCFDRQRDGLVPACAKACPTASIHFGPIEELRDRARKRLAALHEQGVSEAYLYGDKPGATYSELHSFYLLIDRPSTYGLPEPPIDPWRHMKWDYIRTVGIGIGTIAALIAALVLPFIFPSS